METTPKSPDWRFYVYLILLLIPCTEVALRAVGYRPYVRSDYHITSTPAFCLIPDTRMGFALAPGSFSVTINHAHSYRATHGTDSLRVCSPVADSTTRPEIWVLGCSYTYGMGVSDDLHYPAQLQRAFPAYQLKNFAVPGYGTVQSYLQLKRHLLAGEIPKFVVLGYAGFHNERNVMTPAYRKHLHLGFQASDPKLKAHFDAGRVPYAVSSDTGITIQWNDWGTLYDEWPGRKQFALVNALETLSEDQAAFRLAPHETTLQLMLQIDQMCRDKQIPFLVAGLTPGTTSKRMLQALEQNDISVLDIAVDLQDQAFTHAPYDTHPNARAHTEYAHQLTTFLYTHLALLPH